MSRMYQSLWDSIKAKHPDSVTIEVKPGKVNATIRGLRNEKARDVATTVRLVKLKAEHSRTDSGKHIVKFWLEPYRIREQLRGKI